MLTRRGFLGTMLAAAAGAVAQFDPLKGLWVPGVEVAPTEPLIAAPTVAWTNAVIDEQLELNDLARRFAAELAGRLERSSAVVLRRIMLEKAGHTDLGLVTLTDDAGAPQGRGHFEPLEGRVMKEMGPYVGSVGIMYAAGETAHALARADAFVPIGTDLRRGVPFTDCLVGVGTDPASGLSARALRFTTRDGRVHTGLEVAAGRWHGRGARARRRAGRGEVTRRMFLAPELLVDEDASEAASESAPEKLTLGVRMAKEWDISTPVVAGAEQTGETLTTGGWSAPSPSVRIKG